jgi:hypothetical protein
MLDEALELQTLRFSISFTKIMIVNIPYFVVCLSVYN